MAIIDIHFTKLDAKRETPKGKLDRKGINVKSNTKVVDIKKEKLPGIGEAVIVDFEYNVDYEPKIGDIKVGGNLIYHDKNLKDMVKKKDGKLNLQREAFVEVQNAILKAGSIQSLVLARELKLPSPIQLPTLVEETAKEDKKDKKGYA